MVVALYVGRFQPFHKGHLMVIKSILEDVEELIVGIGSSQYSYSIENPFTAGERVLMIKRTLEEEGIPSEKYCVLPIPDTEPKGSHSLWVSLVRTYLPPFQVVYSREPLTKLLFREAGIEVREPPEFDRDKYWASRIRKMMIDGDDSWRDLVPKAVERTINEIRGVERLQELSKVDSPSKL
ncbi:nicotinamide-nucleotide adenylyltransferase [Thermococci archaeon]|nr:MAG: nicotinamide-nucleotide adenylyltransferase [Thermococci archaeon]